ncbi:hypothetical protein [Helicobacter suis]|uniref:hypothetical protein n=2 Tax=Helicobacter suis TaxID=104628 RepID=UPI0002DF3C5F|nr:hypothetical protein [Helicobacter suis]BDR27781.1 hypothetical protein HSHS1_05420 [Helicobacter suis HS1]BDR29012.1 hypothetical protein HSHS1_17730 [Helicobacter suis HS1]
MPKSNIFKMLSIGVVSVGLTLSIAQNIHYFLLYNTSIEALTACAVQPDKTLTNYPARMDLIDALSNHPNNNTIASKVLSDLIKQAKAYGITKSMLIDELTKKLD